MSTQPVPSHEALHAQHREQAIAAAAGQLQASEVRLTRPRQRLLRALAGHSEQVTAEQLAAELASQGVHRATVYRSLELFAATGVVTSYQLSSGITGYHLASIPAGQEHLHAHCRTCGAVVVLPGDVADPAAAAIRSLTGFVLSPARSTLVGQCAQCAASGS